MYVCINNEVVLLNKWWFNKGLLQVVCVCYTVKQVSCLLVDIYPIIFWKYPIVFQIKGNKKHNNS